MSSSQIAPIRPIKAPAPSAPSESIAAEVRKVDPLNAARTHLANERTFLAWIRTSVSLFALGLAVALFYDKQGTLPQVETGIALGLAAAGMLTALFGYRRYRGLHDRIELNESCSRVSRTVGLATGAIIAAGCLVAALIAAIAMT